MNLSFQPMFPWFQINCLLILMAIAALIIRGRHDKHASTEPWRLLGFQKRTRILGLLSHAFAYILLLIAAANPIQTQHRDPNNRHLTVVFDVSESVQRNPQGWDSLRLQVSRFVSDSIQALSNQTRNNTTAAIITFRGGAALNDSIMSLNDLPPAINRLDPSVSAGGAGTHIQSGLDLALSQLEQQAKSGAVLLITDGNQTRGDVLKTAERFTSQGYPIHVYPIEGGLPELAIGAADLPPYVRSGEQTHIRGSLYNSGTNDLATTFNLTRNLGIQDDAQTGPALSVDRQVSLPSQRWAQYRWPLNFEGYGLQFTDLTLSDDTGRVTHSRRFYTHVRRAPRLLSIGGDHRWAGVFDQNQAFIDPIDPEQLTPQIKLADYDAVILSGVTANRFLEGALQRIANSVKRDGLGLLLINGPHSGRQDRDETVLMSYNRTPIEALLPVSSQPRPTEYEPDSRQVVILIDTSGSMSGQRLEVARDIASHIAGNLMRPKDRLDLITFSTGASHLVRNRAMDSAGQDFALRRIQSIYAGGGTDPANALELIGNRRMDACGLIFISDGEFGQLSYRPDCRATVFAIGKDNVPRNSPLWNLSDPIPIPYGFNPANIEIPFFEPQKREKFFEPDSFRPLTMNRVLRRRDRLPDPAAALQGNAVTWKKENAILNLVRPKLTDPILAYAEQGLGKVGVFTTGIPTSWTTRPQSAEAIRVWVRHVTPFQQADRYLFKIEDMGDRLHFKISIPAKDGLLPQINNISAEIHYPDGSKPAFILRPDPTTPNTFQGQFITNRGTQAEQVMLALTESGPDALPRPQRLPLIIPPRGQAGSATPEEAWTYGVNRPLLAQIAQATGGHFPPDQRPLFQANGPAFLERALWPWFALLAFLCYLSAIAMQRWDP